ncbi:Uncharacterized protein TCM_025574 [Theobroma cacao]|uniref:Transmembrane protein n=1 Tax=Theobroma cacao TaxID=3641 RepID=A0A061F6W5_THECC|nr:Uncharacterized protein TCM_025574 [Theobroma cacao]
MLGTSSSDSNQGSVEGRGSFMLFFAFLRCFLLCFCVFVCYVFCDGNIGEFDADYVRPDAGFHQCFFWVFHFGFMWVKGFEVENELRALCIRFWSMGDFSLAELEG